jgi:hypothetical protein
MLVLAVQLLLTPAVAAAAPGVDVHANAGGAKNRNTGGSTGGAQPKAKPPTPSPAPAYAPRRYTPLTEQDQMRADTVRESNAYWEFLFRGIGKVIVLLAWPVVTILLIILAFRIARRVLDAAPANDAVSDVAPAVERNAAFSLTTDEVQIYRAAAQTLVDSYVRAVAAKRLRAVPPLATMMRADAILPSNPEPAFREARDVIASFARLLYGEILQRQLALARLAAARRLTNAEIQPFYLEAQSAGYDRPFDDWLDFLRRNLIIRVVTTGGRSATVYELTDLGTLFLSWCDENGYTPSTVARAGRGV